LAAAFAQRSAGSSRSLPQNNSPSAVVKLGAPKTPSRSASSVCVRSRAAKCFAPRLVEPHQRHAGREQTVLREGIGTPERQLQLRA